MDPDFILSLRLLLRFPNAEPSCQPVWSQLMPFTRSSLLALRAGCKRKSGSGVCLAWTIAQALFKGEAKHRLGTQCYNSPPDLSAFSRALWGSKYIISSPLQSTPHPHQFPSIPGASRAQTLEIQPLWSIIKVSKQSIFLGASLTEKCYKLIIISLELEYFLASR